MMIQLFLLAWGIVLFVFGDSVAPRACGLFMVILNTSIIMLKLSGY